MSETYSVVLADGQRFGPADMSVLKVWAAEGRVPADATIDPTGGGAPVMAGEHPELAGAINAPPTTAVALGTRDTGTDATGGVIPYKNPKALIAYYAGIAALIGLVLPVIGLAISVPALVLGVLGLRARGRDPRIRGAAHAWVGIILGALMTLYHVGIGALIAIGIATGTP